MRRFLGILILNVGFAFFVKGQDVRDVQATLQDLSKVTIGYTLIDSDSVQGRTYIVGIFAILDQTDTLELKEVVGDVGLGITAGRNFIDWDLEEELGRFRGSIVFEIRATPVFVITRPVENTALKRGSSYTFKWYGGGSHTDSLNLFLFKYNELQYQIGTVNDKNKFIWRIPPKTPVRRGFQLRIVGTEKTGIDEFSAPFIIKRRIPLYLQILPIAVAGGVTGYLLSRPEQDQPLPPPPLTNGPN